MYTRHGYSLAELTLVLVIVGLLVVIAVRPIQGTLDHIATHDAAQRASELIGRARDEAIALHTTVAVQVDSSSATMVLRARDYQIARLQLGAIHGVSLSTTRDSIAFDARGLGYGAANLTLVTKRGRSADTVVVSRLGRVR